MKRNVFSCALFIILLLVLSFNSTLVLSDSHTSIDSKTGKISVSFPKNTLGEFELRTDDIKEKMEFYRLTKKALSPYKDLMQSHPQFMNNIFRSDNLFYPVELIIDSKTADWESTLVNAYASQTLPGIGDSFARWEISMKGGLYRRPELSKDGFTLLVCHEIGHHFGGYFYIYGTGGVAIGLSAEGQADYFATNSCLKRIWKDDENRPPYKGPFGSNIALVDLPAYSGPNDQPFW